MHEFFSVGNSLYNNSFNIKKQDLDSKKHLLKFCPGYPSTIVSFSVYFCAGIFFAVAQTPSPKNNDPSVIRYFEL